MLPPHSPYDVPRDKAFPMPDPHQDDAAALARTYRSPALAVVAVVLAIAGLAAFYWGAALLPVHLALGLVTVALSLGAWRVSLRRHRPTGAAVAALGMSLLAVAIALVLYL